MAGVYRFLLSPRWLALHAALVVAVGAFCALGWWQLQAYRDYDRAHADRAADRTPVALSALVQPGRTLRSDAVGRTVVVSGTYDSGQQLLVPGRRLDERIGAYVLTPLVTPDGAVVAVRRGWVSGGDDPAVAVPRGQVSVTGVVEPSEPATASGVERGGKAAAGEVPVIATPELFRRLSYAPERLYEGYVALTLQQPAPEVAPALVAPERSSPGGPRRWQNLSYALQWPLFALAAVFFWVVFARNAAADRRKAGG